MKWNLLISTVLILLIAGCKRNFPVNEQFDINEFLRDDISIKVNPTGWVPQSAEATIKTDRPVEIEWTVEGSNPLTMTREFGSKVNEIPIIGLYAGIENTVSLTLRDINGNWATTKLKIQTETLPDYLPDVELITKDVSLMAPGWHLCGWSLGTGTEFKSRPFAIDPDGEIRWFLAFEEYDKLSLPIRVLDNGNLLIGNDYQIYELDWLGRTKRNITLSGYKQHHEHLILPNGNLLIAVNKDNLSTVEDHVIEIDPSGQVVHEWDIREILDVDRFELANDPVDWFHMNAIFYSEADDCLVISGQRQGVIKVNRKNELQWILAPHQGWGKAGVNGDGHETSDYLLTAVDANGNLFSQAVQDGTTNDPNFDWVWGQHAPMYLPSGNLFVFDNGFNRHYTGAQSFSRAVEYRIDQENMTVEQVWQYGKSRGTDIFSPIISDVDLLSNTNRLMHSGIIFDPTDPRTAIVEVTYPDKQVVWEAILHHKNLSSGGSFNWGDFDLTYRSQRVDLEGMEW